jgi:hypothetical protein
MQVRGRDASARVQFACKALGLSRRSIYQSQAWWCEMNRWNIPDALEIELLDRDMDCVYCRKTFDPLCAKMRATWEHIVNDLLIVTRENIAMCCASCNSSKGKKQLSVWLNSAYCKNHGITKDIAVGACQAQRPDIHPTYEWGHWLLGVVLAAKGDRDGALIEMERVK